MKSRTQSQPLPASAEVQDSESRATAFRISEYDVPPPRAAKASLRSSEPDADALRIAEDRIEVANVAKAEILSEAFAIANLDPKEIAHLCFVSRSLAEKWQKSDQRACPNLIQLLLLPPTFWVAIHRVTNRRYGFGVAALHRLLEDLGIVATSISPESR